MKERATRYGHAKACYVTMSCDRQELCDPNFNKLTL